MADAAMPTTFEGVKTSPNLTLSLQRALDQARELRHRQVGIEHLLLALSDDPDATGSLEACGVDLDRLKTDIAAFVSKSAGAPEGEAAVEPVPSPELRNMLDQAVEAAREAKRQEINSFIVLAAIVGQEKSQAASILQAHGFTFNEAIQALKPRPARPDDDSGSSALRPARRTPGRELEQLTPASRIEEALAQSEHALPPLPTAAPRGPRPAAPRPARPELAVAPISNPPPAAPSPAAQPPSRAPLQSDDIMASIRDKAGPPRGLSGARTTEAQRSEARTEGALEPRAGGGLEQGAGTRPPTPQPAVRSQPPSAPQPLPQPAPQQRAPSAIPPPVFPLPHASPPPPTRSPAPGRPEGIGSGSAPDHRSVEPFDLGAPLPEERLGGMARGPRDVEAEAPAMRRREPALGTPPQSAPQAAAPNVSQPPSQPPPLGAHPRPTQGMASAARPAAPPSPRPVAHPSGPPPGAGVAPPGMRAPAPVGAPPQAQPPIPAPRGGGRRNNLETVNAGQLAEAIPRRMRALVPERVEVRIARRSFDGLAVGIEGRGAPVSHDIVITSAMSVRLKAPDGGFAIDGVTPETQWIENRPGLISNDEFASWRWTVTPLTSGRRRLHLIVSARTAGPDGSTAETALPDQVIEIKVRTNYAVAVRRWGGWIAAAVIGGALGKFGEGTLDLLRKLAGL